MTSETISLDNFLMSLSQLVLCRRNSRRWKRSFGPSEQGFCVASWTKFSKMRYSLVVLLSLTFLLLPTPNNLQKLLKTLLQKTNLHL